jgi:hypothetical protein
MALYMGNEKFQRYIYMFIWWTCIITRSREIRCDWISNKGYLKGEKLTISKESHKMRYSQNSQSFIRSHLEEINTEIKNKRSWGKDDIFGNLTFINFWVKGEIKEI